ncbi:MAG: hypothetical protein ACC650_01340 [Gammaproteobacteria bacterium]
MLLFQNIACFIATSREHCLRKTGSKQMLAHRHTHRPTQLHGFMLHDFMPHSFMPQTFKLYVLLHKTILYTMRSFSHE